MLRNKARKATGMRRRIAFVAAGSAFALMFGAVPAFADNGPHLKGAGGVLPDSCAGCHRLHTAKTDMLTLDAQPQLCYTCHGTTGTGATTDVQNGVAYTANPNGSRSATKAGALRGGGFEYALISAGSPTGQRGKLDAAGVQIPPNIPAASAGAPVTSSHSVDNSTQTAWGNGAIGTATAGSPIQLRCGSCHDPHGNGNYRILRPLPEQGTPSPGVNNTGTANAFSASGTYTGVITDAVVKDYTTTNYWASADVNAPAYIANVSEWCSTCHTRYLATRDKLGTVTTPGQRSRADSGDATFTYRHTSSQGTAGGKNCITCHVSHGSNATMGLFSGSVGNPVVGAPSSGGVTGDSKLLRVNNRGTCLMCHSV